MSVSPSESEREVGFAIEPRNPVFEANCSRIDDEIRPGRTVSLVGEVNLLEVERLRANAPTLRKPAYTTFAIKAVALALREFPLANRRVARLGFGPFSRPRVQSLTRCDVAVAIERDMHDAGGTALIDIFRDADLASLDDITSFLLDLGKADPKSTAAGRELRGPKTRVPNWISRRLLSPREWLEDRGGAVLVSSPVKNGVDAVLGSWSHPIGVSFGAVKLRPVVVGNSVAPRPTFFLSLNFDRRILAGAQAARFFHRIVEILEHAETEMKPYLPQEAPPTREDFPTVDEPVTQL